VKLIVAGESVTSAAVLVEEACRSVSIKLAVGAAFIDAEASAGALKASPTNGASSLDDLGEGCCCGLVSALSISCCKAAKVAAPLTT